MCRYDLRLSDAEFRSLTMRRFGALYRYFLKVSRQRTQREDYRAGVLASLTYNMNRDPDKSEARGPEHFFPTLQGLNGDAPPRSRQQTQKQIDRVFERHERRRQRRARA